MVGEPIEKQIEDLQKHFKRITIQTYDTIDDMRMSVGRLKARLVSLPIQYKEEHEQFFQQTEAELDSCSSMDAIWRKLSRYWNYLNYTLLESFVESLDDASLTGKMKQYVGSLHLFQQCTRVCDFAQHCPSTIRKRKEEEEDLKEFVLRLDLNWEVCTLEDVDRLAGHIMRKFHLPSFAMSLKEASCGSLQVTWLLPTLLAMHIRTDAENTDLASFRKEHGILSINVDGEKCVYLAVRHYAAHLRDTYLSRRKKNLAPFKLARVIREDVESKLDDFTRSTIRGDLDDIKAHMNEEEVGRASDKQPRVVLIEGAPGVGKTTFSEQFCYKWSQGQRLSNHRLLVLLPMRDKGVRAAKNVRELFLHPTPKLQEDVAEEVERSGGEGVALWLEAWDELEEDLRRSSVFVELVHGRVLPKATIFITSRPWATRNIRESVSLRVDQLIEIVSTPSIQFNRVLKEDRIKPDNRAGFIDYVNYNYRMKAAMQIPATADIVADVFQWSQD